MTPILVTVGITVGSILLVVGIATYAVLVDFPREVERAAEAKRESDAAWLAKVDEWNNLA